MPNLLLAAKNTDGDPKKKKLKSQYGMYSGIVSDGKEISKPTEQEAAKNMIQYMKNNTPESNVYHQKFMHHSTIFDRKKPLNTA